MPFVRRRPLVAGSGRRNADEALASHLAAGWSYQRAAAKCGVSLKTIYRRMREAQFRKLVDQRKSELVSLASAKLGKSMGAAARELARLMKSSDERVRLAAAREILTVGLKARQLVDLEQRLDGLEAALGEGTHGDATGAAIATGAAGPLPADAGRPADAGGDPAGQGECVPAGHPHNDPRRVAGGGTQVDGPTELTPLLSPERQEYDGRRGGVG